MSRNFSERMAIVCSDSNVLAHLLMCWHIYHCLSCPRKRYADPLSSKSGQIFWCLKRCRIFWNICKNKFLTFFIILFQHFKFLGLGDFCELYSETLTSDAPWPVGSGDSIQKRPGLGQSPWLGFYGVEPP